MSGSGVIAPTPDPNLSKTLTSLSITPKKKGFATYSYEAIARYKSTWQQKEMNLSKKIKNKKQKEMNKCLRPTWTRII